MPGMEFQKVLEEVGRILAAELASASRGEGKVLVQKPVPELLRELDFERVVHEGGADLARLLEVVVRNSTRLRHPRFMAHQVAVPLLPSVIADMAAGFLNNGMAVYEMGPAGTAIEVGVVRWLLEKAGWPEGDGVLVHGGSLANLSCLLAARARALPHAWEEGVPAGCSILASETAHYSVVRAAAILGFGAKAVVKVAVDERLRMVPKALREALRGRKAVVVVANAGATASGAYDPLREIAKICRGEGVWLHVDGAHGASALVSPRFRGLMEGIAAADSLSWDAHKLLGTSALCGAALVRDPKALAASYTQEAPYLFGEEARPGEDLSKKTFECTKTLLGLKLFFNLATSGEDGMAAHVERLFDQARRFHERISARPGFESFGPPDSNILCFRHGRDSARQDRVRARLVAAGDYFITRTRIRGETWLRLVVMNPLTSDADLDALLAAIEAAS